MPETIGQQLKAAREARNLTFARITQTTHIQARLLQALEDDDFEVLSSPVQARAFLRIYAEYLDLSLDDLMARQLESIAPVPAQAPATESVQSMPAPSEEASQEDLAPEGSSASSTPEPETLQPSTASEKPGWFSALVKSLTHRKSIPTSTGSETSPPPDETETDELTFPSESEEPEIPEALPAGPSIPLSESQQIFQTIGKSLRRQREILSFSLNEIEDHTHIRMHYLQAMESGNLDHLPSSVQARGMLNNYAHFLDMDVEALLLQFAEGLQMQRLERQPIEQGQVTGSVDQQHARRVLPAALRRYISMDIIVGVTLVVVLMSFAIWGTSRIIKLRSAETPFSTAQSISEMLAVSPPAGTPTSSDTPAPDTGTVETLPADVTSLGTLVSAGSGPVQVVVVAQQQAYLRVTVDGVKQFDGRVSPGNAYPFGGKNQVEVLTGDGAALSIIYNQSNLGALGSLGEVVDRIYTADSILEPTATNTPTSTITPTATVTPLFSPTPTKTPTSLLLPTQIP